jgi:hypothetical protein
MWYFRRIQKYGFIERRYLQKITGWSKIKFVRFSNYINNIRETAGRNKKQLIAFNRFWLKKGLDQSSLAMLKCKTAQQQISHYLSQIRNAMNIEFVSNF